MPKEVTDAAAKVAAKATPTGICPGCDGTGKEYNGTTPCLDCKGSGRLPVGRCKSCGYL